MRIQYGFSNLVGILNAECLILQAREYKLEEFEQSLRQKVDFKGELLEEID
jgi:hypothetical protein